MNDDLFPEAELRSFLKQHPAPCQDLAFESAVLDSIRDQERQALMFVAYIASVGATLLMLIAVPFICDALIRLPALLASIPQFLNALRPLQDFVSLLLVCAHSARLAAWLLIRPIILTLAVLLFLAAVARSLVARLPLRPTQLFI